MMSNRIQQIASNSDAAVRQQLYRNLDKQLSKGEKLSPFELSSLLDQISRETAQYVRATLWRIAMRQECNPQLVSFFGGWTNDSAKPDRNMALRFVRECRPDDCVELGRTFANDPDTLVRYEAALCLREIDRDKSLGKIIDLFSELPLNLQEEAEMYILERGTSNELERVRLNAKLRESGNSYEVLARSLESRLTSK